MRAIPLIPLPFALWLCASYFSAIIAIVNTTYTGQRNTCAKPRIHDKQVCIIDDANRDIVCSHDLNYPNGSIEFNLGEQFRLLEDAYCGSNCTANRDCHFANLFVENIPTRTIDVDHFNINDYTTNISLESLHVYSAEELQSIGDRMRSKYSKNNVKNVSSWTGLRLSKQLFINSPSKLDGSVLQALLSPPFDQVVQTEVSLRRDAYHRILAPSDNDGQRNNRLTYLIFRSDAYSIESIENFAFTPFTRLAAISFAGIPIRHIAPNGLRIGGFGNRSVVINLDGCQLNDQILDSVLLISNTSFDSNQNISITLMLDNNQITRLSAKLFQAFLNVKPENVLSVYGNPINCATLKWHRWLLRDRQKYRHQIWGAHCSDSNKNLFELPLYEAKCRFDKNDNGDGTLRCANIEAADFDIRAELDYLTETAEHELKSIQTITINNCTTLSQIDANTFVPLPRLHSVHLINLPWLRRIDRKAFGDGGHAPSTSVRSLTIGGETRLSLIDVLQLINSLPNLQNISTSFAAGQYILPKNAFAANHLLRRIEFTTNNYRLLSVGANFVSKLSLLEYLKLSHISIAEIAFDAFAIERRSNDTFHLNLSGCGLDETKLRNRPFKRINRPIFLDLSNNSIQILDKDNFDFLLQNSNHQIDFNRNKLICNFDIDSEAESLRFAFERHPYWWLYQSNANQTNKLRKQIHNAKCADAQNINVFDYLESLLERPQSVTSTKTTLSPSSQLTTTPQSSGSPNLPLLSTTIVFVAAMCCRHAWQ